MTKRIINKRLRTGVLAAALAGGSILGLSQIGTVNAQVDDSDPEPAEEPAEEPGDSEDRPGRRGQRLEPLAEILGMDTDALREALRSGSTLADVATDQGVAVDTVVDAIVDSKTERIETAVEDGRITQEQADERLADLEESVTTRVNEGRPEGEGRGPRGIRGGQRLEPLAEILGMDTDTLGEALRTGSTLADVATDQGVAVDTVVGAIVDSKTERIETAVEDGRITQEQADERLADLEESVTTRVNEGRPERGDGGGEGFGGPRGARGPQGGAPADAPAPADA